MGVRDLLFVGIVVGGAATLGAGLYPRPASHGRTSDAAGAPVRPDERETARRVDAAFREGWRSAGVRPAATATTRAVLRRASLALTGTIPSLEELRSLEALPEDRRVDAHVDRLLADRRFADDFAERFARAFVGTEGGPFVFFRRRRFVSWLSDQIGKNRGYDAVVRDLIASNGLWTDRPSTNFVTVTYDPDRKEFDPDRLAGRVTRAFLGARLDCARCHDHPFAPWKQDDFRGLAAFFGRAESHITGLHEGKGEYRPDDRKTGKPVVVAPRVPFLPELLPAEGPAGRREQLARWVTDPKNPALPRATVNRVWALMFGRPLVAPVDDLPKADDLPEPLTLLADDFAAHGFDLRRLVRVIASTEAFRLDSALSDGLTEAEQESAERAWAAFPVTRLRPEQVVDALIQGASLTTIDADSPVLLRIAKSLGQQAFLERYGDAGEDEFDEKNGTIPQRLLLMNGDLVRDKTKPDVFNAGSRIGWFAPTDRAAVDLAFLTVLTRSPTAEESRHFAAKLAGSKGEERGRRMSDLMWSLVNVTEFSWNH